MTNISFLAYRNILINSLGEDDLGAVGPYLERVPLDEGQIIACPGALIRHVWFPEGGVASLADVMRNGSRLEVGIVGRDGMIGASLLLGCERVSQEAVVRVGGSSALRVEADRLHALCERSTAARALFLRFVHVSTIQTARTLGSNLRDSAEKCLSRWLLMYHDRIDADVIELTHKTIAAMLGFRRATVTDTLHVLEEIGAIKSSRCRIVIRDRAALEAAAGEAYGYAENQYGKLIAPFGRDQAARVQAVPMQAGMSSYASQLSTFG